MRYGFHFATSIPSGGGKTKLRKDHQEAIGPNDIWAMDFVHDKLAMGQKLRILTIVAPPFEVLPCDRSPLRLP
jgi:putative transposase